MQTLLEKTKPAGQGGFRIAADRERNSICRQNTADSRDLQAIRLRSRFALSWPLARRVAELAYEGGAA